MASVVTKISGDTINSSGWFDWAYKGVDPSFPGNGGSDCRDFLSIPQRLLESVAGNSIAMFVLIYACPRMKLLKSCSCSYIRKHDPLGKRILLVLMCLTYGVELGFKFATRQIIWILNPCHIVTMMQIFILAAPPSRVVTAAFRLHMHMLPGALIAILFPVTNTLLLPFETSVYFIQHFLMLVIPFYLMHAGDPYIPERQGDFSWAFTSLGFLLIYHFGPLQLLAYVSEVNLNNMLCPAVSDPFQGKYYRVFATSHQLILIALFGKGLVLIAKAFKILSCDTASDVAQVCSCGPNCSCCQVVDCLSDTNKENNPPSCNQDSVTNSHSGCAVAKPVLSDIHRDSNISIHTRPCHSRGDDHSSCFEIYSHGICRNQFSTQQIGKGHSAQEIADDEKPYRRKIYDATNCCQGSFVSHRLDNNDQYSSTSLTDSQLFGSDQENGLNKVQLMSDLGKSQNGHAKSH